MNADFFTGWIFGILSSLISGLVLFLLQTRRDVQKERLIQRREDARIARNWAADGKMISLRGFDLSGENLSGKDLAQADLEEANFQDGKLYGTDFTGTNLRLASFQKTKLVGVCFREANLLAANFSGATLREVNFSHAKMHLTQLQNAKKIERCIWTSATIDDTTTLPSELRASIEQQILAEKTANIDQE